MEPREGESRKRTLGFFVDRSGLSPPGGPGAGRGGGVVCLFWNHWVGVGGGHSRCPGRQVPGSPQPVKLSEWDAWSHLCHLTWQDPPALFWKHISSKSRRALTRLLRTQGRYPCAVLTGPQECLLLEPQVLTTRLTPCQRLDWCALCFMAQSVCWLAPRTWRSHVNQYLASLSLF